MLSRVKTISCGGTNRICTQCASKNSTYCIPLHLRQLKQIDFIESGFCPVVNYELIRFSGVWSNGFILGKNAEKIKCYICNRGKTSRSSGGFLVVEWWPLFLWYQLLSWLHTQYSAFFGTDQLWAHMSLLCCAMQGVSSVVWKRKGGWKNEEGKRWDWYYQQCLARLSMPHETQQLVQLLSQAWQHFIVQ